MKRNGRRVGKRRSSEQFRIKYSHCTSPHDQGNKNHHNLSIAMPLSIENVRYHNQKSQIHNNQNQSIVCETPSTLRRCKSLPQSHTVTPTPYTAIASPRINGTNEITNEIPFISEDVSTHSVNSVSSYPSLLALKLSFTNQPSIISPMHPPQLQIAPLPVQNGEETDVPQSSGSSFYDNEDDDDDDIDEHDDDDVVHDSRKQSTHSQRVPPTPRPSNNHKKRHHSNHIIQQNVIINSDKIKTQKRKTINVPPAQKRSTKHRFLSTASSNSLLDHEDKYDPPQPSIRLSVSAAAAANAANSSGTSSNNKKEDKVHGIKVTKVPRNGQYPTYATALQSVVEEVSEQSSLEQHNAANNKSKPSNNSDASKEYHQYKQRQQAFNQIINKNKQQIKHNANSMNMSVNININNDHSNHNTNNMQNNLHMNNKQNLKRKKRFYNKSKSSSSSSLVITKNKNKNKRKRSNVDIRRPQTTRRVRVSSPMLNIKHKRQSNTGRTHNTNRDHRRMYRYELNSDETSDILSDTTITSTSSVTSISNDTTSVNIPHSDARTAKGIPPSTKRSSSISISPAHSNLYNMNNKHYPRRPVTIIRRAANNNKSIMNPMMRATSAMYSQLNNKHQKIGLFDTESFITSQFTPRFRVDAKDSSGSGPSGWEFLERDKFFLESKYRSYAGSEISFDYENIDDKLSANTNFNHDLCKKEVHDAYERGFLAGYFLGVNIMQQQQKDKDNRAIAK